MKEPLSLTEIAEEILRAARNAKPHEWTEWNSFSGSMATKIETQGLAENKAVEKVLRTIWPRDATGNLMPKKT